MFDRQKWILERLGSMELGELDSLGDMKMRGTDGWEKIAGPFKATLIGAYTNDAFADGELSSVVSELADGLAPVYARDIFWELTVIGSAWDLPHGDVDEGYSVEPGGSLQDVAKAALCRAYEDGLQAVAQALEGEADQAEADAAEEQPEDDDPDEVAPQG